MSLREGDPAPDFELTDHTGVVHRSKDLRGRWIVLFFYPRDFSPVCTAQSCAFRDATPRLKALGACVLGVSPDDDSSHARFADQHGLAYPLVADTGGAVSAQFKVKRAGFGLIPGRETIVIAPDGRVAMVYRALLQGAAHAAKALSVIEAGSPRA